MPRSPLPISSVSTAKLTQKEQAWRALFTLFYPQDLPVWERFSRCKREEVQHYVQTHCADLGITPDIPLDMTSRISGLNEWAALYDALRKIQQKGVTISSEAERIAFVLPPKRYSLDAQMITYLRSFLEEYPEELSLWEAAWGRTPRQVAGLIANEIARRHLLMPPDIEVVRQKLGTALTWGQLTLFLSARALPQANDNYGLACFIDLVRALIDSLPQRHDQYDTPLHERDWVPVLMRPNSGAFYQELIKSPSGTSLSLPPAEPARCRLCWRYTLVHPDSPSSQAPLCYLHDMSATTAEYRARFRKKLAAEQGWRRLAREHKALYQATKDTREAWVFIRELLLSPASPLPLLAEHMRRHVSPDADNEALVWAYLSPDSGSIEEKNKAALEDFVRFAVSTPMPITFQDCLIAEAWLQAMQDKRIKRG